MRRLAILLALALIPVPATAGGLWKDAGPGNFGKNVRFVGHIPTNNDSPGAKIVGQYLYLTTSNSLRIYDIRRPTDPQLVSVYPRPQTPYVAQEDVDTNGRILLIDTDVIDVTNKAEPKLLAEHGLGSHTISCILDCTWAYGSDGRILDLRNPAQPRLSAARWGSGKPATSGHDVTEVAPGIVMTSSDPVMLLDARQNPEAPTLMAQSPRRNRFTHSAMWPNGGTDKLALVSGESQQVNCTSPSAQFVTLDASDVQRQGFKPIAEYRVEAGLPTEGKSPANQWCTHWFDDHPRFKNGGLVAIAWYEHGVRFLRVSPTGQISEVGWFIGAGTSASGAYWVTDRVVYVADYNRGLDIIEYQGRI